MVLVVAWLAAGADLVRTQVDPVAADALWQHALAVSEGDLGHPVFLDAQRAALRVRPWQTGFRTARARARDVARARVQDF